MGNKKIYHFDCFLCSHNEKELLYTHEKDEKPVLNYICKNCGFISLLPKDDNYFLENSSPSLVRKDKFPSNQEIKHFESIAFQRIKLLEKTIQIYPSSTPSKKILDIGCGTGSFLFWMKAAGWEVDGLETNSFYANAANERYSIKVKSCSLIEYQTSDRYEIISSFHLIEQADDPNAFLSKIRLLLKKNGYLIVESSIVSHIYGKTLDDFFKGSRINTFSNNTLKAFLLKNGFDIIHAQTFGGIIKIVAKKTEQKENYIKYYDDYKNIKKIVKNYSVNKATKLAPIGIIKGILRRGKNILTNVEKNLFPKTGTGGSLKVIHGGFHHSKNAGDIALFVSLRKLFSFYHKDTSYTLLNIHNAVTEEVIAQINKHDLFILGGGGLFLKDTNPNNISGWQWPCSIEMLRKIKVPIIVFAVGYNRFRKQENFDDIFFKNVNELVKKSNFFSLRNHGSITKVQDFLPPDIAQKVKFQPCSTTVVSKFIDIPKKVKKNRIAFNLAFDRHFHRYGTSIHTIMNRIVQAIIEIQKLNYEVVLVNHVTTDTYFNVWLKKNGVSLREVDLVGATFETIVENYLEFDLVFGTRGHAQMIPFGLGIPIFSLISHNKLYYFLEDINLTQLGVEIGDENLFDVIVNFVKDFDLDQQVALIEEKKNLLWNKTKENFNQITSLIPEHSPYG